MSGDEQDRDPARARPDEPALAESLARAEAAVARLAADYPNWALSDLARARAAAAALSQGTAAEAAAALAALRAVAHDMKGQGGAFGYPLVTRFAQSLGRLAAGLAVPPDAASLAAVEAHLDALALVLERRIAGEGGAAGRRLAERLETLGERPGG